MYRIFGYYLTVGDFHSVVSLLQLKIDNDPKRV